MKAFIQLQFNPNFPTYVLELTHRCLTTAIDRSRAPSSFLQDEMAPGTVPAKECILECLNDCSINT